MHGAYITVAGLKCLLHRRCGLRYSIRPVSKKCTPNGTFVLRGRSSDRPEADAQAATPRVSTWSTWAREKKPVKVVEGFPGFRSQDWAVSACVEPETLAPERKKDDERIARLSQPECGACLDSTSIGLCEMSRETCDVRLLLGPPGGRLAGTIGFDRWR